MVADGKITKKGEKLKSGMPLFSFGCDLGKGILFWICFELQISILNKIEFSEVCSVDISKSWKASHF